MNPFDLATLRAPLALFAFVTAAGAAGIHYTAGLVRIAEGKMSNQRATLLIGKDRYQRSGDEKETIVRYLGDYEQLQREGVVGEEQRINWIDGLRLANIQSELFGVDYQIGVQQPFVSGSGFDAGGLKLRQSVMKIRAPLLHEGDLLRFLETLERQRVGLFTMNQCALGRAGPIGSTPRYQPNLSAECELTWVTVIEDIEKERKT
jgi:hypothetical protein